MTQTKILWDDDTTWELALANVTAVYLVYYPDLVAPGAVDAVRRFIERAVASGARRLVLLSGRGEEQAQLAEQALMDSGATWTVVRSAFFAQNFSEKAFVDSIRSGVLALPAADVGEPFIDADDIADVVVAALTQDGVPDVVISALTEVFTTVLDGRNAYLTNGVHRALGRQPRDFADYARGAATGVWTASTAC